MKKILLISAMGVAAASGTGMAAAQEVGRVISSTPVIQQVAVPRQVCSNQPVVVQQPNTGGGAILGGIAGGAIGNQIGSGSGRAAATMLGLVGGALLGNSIEGHGQQVQNAQQCSTQTSYENRTVGYNVVYEYAGKQYNVQMPNDPGPTVQLQITPMTSTAQPAAEAPSDPRPAAGTPVGVIVGQPAITTSTAVYPAPYPVYYQPRPYYYPYYAPIGISLGIGYTHHRHR